ncbi:MAG: phosphodiesterase [Pseudomonadota bacterium]
MTRILQISDTHIVEAGALAYDRIDTGAYLCAAMTRILEIAALTGPLDAILVSGDLTDHGTAVEYERFRALTSAAPAPLFVIPGNHDARAPMRAGFGLPGAPDDPIHFEAGFDDTMMIGLDVTIPGEPDGDMTEEAQGYLTRALRQADGRPVLLALHHPPFATGIAHMDRIGLANADRLAEAIAGHKGELRIVCGHVHRCIMALCGEHPAMIAPSTAHAVAFDLRPDGPVELMMEPPGALLHVIGESIVTHRLFFGDAVASHSF